MTSADYRAARDKARFELKRLLRRRSNLDTELAKTNNRIAEVSKALEALDMLVGDTDTNRVSRMLEMSGLNLTEAVYKVLEDSNVHLTAIEIQRELRRLGFSTAEYTNPGATVHTILKRLKENNQADLIVKDGKSAYRLLPEG